MELDVGLAFCNYNQKLPNTMDGNQKTVSPASKLNNNDNMKDKGNATITPPGKKEVCTYEGIVSGILEKKDRKLCDDCLKLELPREENKSVPYCVYFRYEDILLNECKQAMNNPKECYRSNREQGARLACYKLYTTLEHGRLGRSRRKPLPACVEARIKIMQPSKNFTGYKEKKKEKEKLHDSSSDDDTWEGTSSPLKWPSKKPRYN